MCVCSALISSTPDLLFSPKPQLCPDWLRNKLPPICPAIGPFKSPPQPMEHYLIVFSQQFISQLSGSMMNGLVSRCKEACCLWWHVGYTQVWCSPLRPNAAHQLLAIILTPFCPVLIPLQSGLLLYNSMGHVHLTSHCVCLWSCTAKPLKVKRTRL